MSHVRIILKHILPNSIAPVIVQATLSMGYAVLTEAALGFIGVGVQPPTPTWGSMLQQAFPMLDRQPLLSIVPGVAIFLLVLAFNFVGDALRDVLDPQAEGRDSLKDHGAGTSVSARGAGLGCVHAGSFIPKARRRRVSTHSLRGRGPPPRHDHGRPGSTEMITRIEIDGFKTFRGFSLDLGPFMAIVGPNGAGKSNLFDAVTFLSGLAQNDIGGAMQALRGTPVEVFRRTRASRRRRVMTFAVEVLLKPEGMDAFGNAVQASCSAAALRSRAGRTGGRP